MNSNPRNSYLVWSALLLLTAVVATPCLAQEEAPPEDTGNRLGNVYFEFGTWVAQPSGLQYVPATYYDDSGSIPIQSNLEIGHGTEAKTQWAVAYALPSNHGRFTFGFYKQSDVQEFGMLDPTQFVYGEALAHGMFPGYRNDTLADGFLSRTNTQLRELRFEYSREAFRTPRVSVDWFVGWRRVEHSRKLDVTYLALVPDLPTVLPPACQGVCPDLSPEPDSAGRRSNYEGRGATVGFDIEFPLWKNNVVFEGSVGVSVLRGDLSAGYRSTNSYYVLTQDIPGRSAGILCMTDATCDSDYELFDDVVQNGTVFVATEIDQRDASIAVRINGSSATNLIIENSLGFRWRTPYKRLEVVAGFRQVRYDDVAVDIKPTVIASAPDNDFDVTLTATSVDETSRSVTYEGFFGGVVFRLY